MRRVDTGFIVMLAAIACGIASGCTSPTRSIDQATLDQRVAQHQERVLEQRDRTAWRFLRRMELLHAAHRAQGRDEAIEINVLLLSSGGQYGAFGAGVLHGWSHSQDTSLPMPTFDIVTGVSTGAMIAPFVLSGEDYSFQRIAELFKQADNSFATLRGIFFFLPWRSSIFDTRVLRDRIQAEVDSETIAQVAAAHNDHRMLLIGAVDLDLGRFHIWDMGTLAEESLRTGDPAPFHDALISSASIPGAFPAIEIDGVLYSDGAAALATFLGLDRDVLRQVVGEFKQRNPDAATPRLRMWMIVNGHIDPPAELAEQRWASVALRSAAVLTGYSLRGTLRLMQLGSELIGRDIGQAVEFRYISVPDDVELPEPENRLFDQQFMIELHALGYRMRTDPNSWRTQAIAPDIPGSSIILRDIPFDKDDLGP